MTHPFDDVASEESNSDSENEDDEGNETSRSPSPIQSTCSPSSLRLRLDDYVTGEEDLQGQKKHQNRPSKNASPPMWAIFLSNRCTVKGGIHNISVYQLPMLTTELKEWVSKSKFIGHSGNITAFTLGSKLTTLSKDPSSSGVTKKRIVRGGKTQIWYRFDWKLFQSYLISRGLFLKGERTPLTHDDDTMNDDHSPFDTMSESLSVQGYENDMMNGSDGQTQISSVREQENDMMDGNDESVTDEDFGEYTIDGDDNDDGGFLENEPLPNQRNVKNSGAGAHVLKCWLCTFSNSPMAVDMTDFITSNIHRMDLFYISSQVRNAILEKYPSARGARKREIARHISRHMITGNVRMATNIHSLTMLAENLRSSMYQRDPETNELVIDTKVSDQYLKVIAQITQIYKCDTKRLLF